jgi:hypothetical protein
LVAYGTFRSLVYPFYWNAGINGSVWKISNSSYHCLLNLSGDMDSGL